jgi:putative ABC transport system permease protein
MWRHLLPLTLAEWRHHPWRHAAALLAVALGVALASSVQMINASALSEFAQAVRAVNGQPDVVLTAEQRAGFDDALMARVAMDAAVTLASPVLELDSTARRDAPGAAGSAALGSDLTAGGATTLNPNAPPGQARPAGDGASDAQALPTAPASAAVQVEPASQPNKASPPPAPARSTASSPAVATADRTPVRVVGVDALKVFRVAPALMPRPDSPGTPASGDSPPADGAASARPAGGVAGLLADDAAYLNPAALARLGLAPGDALWLQSAGGWQRLRVAGRVSAGGGPLVVMDIAAVQSRFGLLGRLTRLDVQLVAGTPPGAWSAALGLPAGVRAAAPDEAVARISNLSRAYRVNLGVLALVALLVGGFLVYSVVSLSVAQRTPQLALLGVLGLAAADRRRWVLAEAAVVGLVGSAAGLAAGAALAALALRLLGGDLGGGYFPGVAPALVWPVLPLAACGVLGTVASVAGAWWPARQAQALSPAQALKGLGQAAPPRAPVWPGLALLVTGGALALAPPIGGLPLAAYAAVALLLAGGVSLVPAVVALLVRAPTRRAQALAGDAVVGRTDNRPATPGQRAALLLPLAIGRARFARQTAAATVAGVVASLALSVAITVMVASFRAAVADWLGAVLPADLYLRTAPSTGAADQAVLPADLPAAAAQMPGVLRVSPSRQVALTFSPEQPAITLIARPLGDEPARNLPLLGEALPAVPGTLGVWVSEPAAAIHGWQVGDTLVLPLVREGSTAALPTPARVRGVWRDYARQFGAVAIDLADYQRLTGDSRLNDLALWLAPGTAPATVVAALRQRAGPSVPLDSATTSELRKLSLQIFDRSFAVTVYLQAVAIGVGLVGVAASLSAQVLARRKEFGLLAHLGFTRAQVMRLMALETAAWLGAGVVVGLALGLAMAVVLVDVVNPQSFHWTMPLHLPLPRLGALAAAVLAAGTATALWAARRAAGRSAVLAVKEDW